MAPEDEGVKSSRTGRQTLPADRFDTLPKTRRVGAHRIAARPRRFWHYLLAAVAGIALLTTAGIIAVQVFGAQVGSFTTDQGQAEAAPAEQVAAEIDPEATIAILNGTSTPDLQSGLEQVIVDNGWGQIAFTDYAASREVEISAVFYGSPEDATAAAGLAEQLGGVSTYESSDYAQYGVRLVVLLGADYAGPGYEQAAELSAQDGDTAQ